MKSRIISTVMIFMLLTGIASVALYTSPAYAATTLYVDPSVTTKQYSGPGSTFTVTVKLDDVVDLFGFDLQITWDENLITYFSESYIGNLQVIWGPTEDTNWTVTAHTAAAGSYRFTALALKPTIGYTGSHELLTLGFTIKDPGTNSKKETPLSFAIHKLSNSTYQSITHTVTDGTYEIWGKTPTLSVKVGSLTAKTCRKLDEQFDVTVSVSDAASVTGFDFEIDYDTVLLDYVSGTVNPGYGSGTITPDDLNGKVTGTTTGTADGSITLVTITFKAVYSHIWKDELTISGWHNINTGQIYIQTATLKYPQPDLLQYTKGGSGNKINIGSEVTYTWSPIQGDIDLDGDVDIFDLRTVANFYDQVSDTWNLTGADGMIDIFDLVVIATNFGFTYSSP